MPGFGIGALGLSGCGGAVTGDGVCGVYEEVLSSARGVPGVVAEVIIGLLGIGGISQD